MTERATIDKNSELSRRYFLCRAGAFTAATVLPWSGAAANAPGIPHNLPARPKEKPLVWRPIADAFDSYILDPANKVMFVRPDGRPYFASAPSGRSSDELTTYGPIVMGKILRGENVTQLLPSLAGYFHQDAGIFLNSPGRPAVECWYLMNILALAAAVIRTRLSDDPPSLARLRSSADTLIKMVQQLGYDFSHQGYDFTKGAPWTRKDIYRQPDTVGGYAYLSLLAFEAFGDGKYLEEALKGMLRYQSFRKNPWYEIPCGSMACLAAARLSAHHRKAEVDLLKTLMFALDPAGGALQNGEWGGREVNGLMRGWGGGDRDEAYSMESLVTLPYLLPVARYAPQFAGDIGRLALNVSANMRWFYSQHLPEQLQSKPGLAPEVPYERLSRKVDGRMPFATGDFGTHKSIYGGAYSLWAGELVRPTSDPFILRLDVAKTDFLTKSAYPTYLYYNPWEDEREVALDLGADRRDVYDLATHRLLKSRATGSVPLWIAPHSSRVVVLIPPGLKRSTERGTLVVGGVPVDYGPRG